MISLLAFAWMSASWVTFMAENRVRLASSTRHSAWKMGHGLAPVNTPDDFYNTPGLIESQSNTTARITSEPFFLGMLAVKPLFFTVYQTKPVIRIQTGATGRFFDKTLSQSDLILMDKKEEPTFIGKPVARWPDMFEFLEDRDEVQSWILP